jgi:hypothetical protein
MSQKILRRFVSLMLGLALLVSTSVPRTAYAAGPWYVTPTGNDADDCLSPGTACATINGAIVKASPGDSINVAEGIYTGTGFEVVFFDKSATLAGGWNASFTTQSGISTLDGQGARRGITSSTSNLTIFVDHFMIQNGSANDGGGIGISNSGTQLTLSNSIIASNTAGNGGGISFVGSLTLNNSTVSGNTATASGGGIWNLNGTLTLNNSTISGNTAGASGGGIKDDGFMTILNNSTVSGNTASGNGGGINYGSNTLLLNNSSVAVNTAGTIGGGLGSDSSGGIVTLQNTILAGNTAGTGPECSGVIGSSGYNLIGNDSDCTFTSTTGDQVGTSSNPINPRWGPLQDNGGPTFTHALQTGSPAIDAGNPAAPGTGGNACLATDQRGLIRPTGAVCDIGAFEGQVPATFANIAGNAGVPGATLSYIDDTPMAATADGSGLYSFAVQSGWSGTVTPSKAGYIFTPINKSYVNVFTDQTEQNYTARAIMTWYVSPTGNDSNSCSAPDSPCLTINGAISKAADGDSVDVAVGTYTGTGTEVALLDKSILLLGGWDASFSTQSDVSIIDAENLRRGITVNSGVIAIVERFVVQNGDALATGATAGGGIANGGTLTLNNSTISGNAAYDQGGGIYNFGSLILNNSTVSHNTTTANFNFNGGGGILNANASSLILNNSTVSGNSTSGFFEGGGGGILNWQGTVILNNSTFSNNASSTKGGGIDNSYGGVVILRNTIVAGNTSSSGADCSGSLGSSGYNLVGNLSGCSFAAAAGDITDTDPLLGSLQDNGGLTFTHALLPQSSAIDAGNIAGCTDQDGNPIITDQRGVTRPQGIGCDIGAYEYAFSTPGPATSLAVLTGNNQVTSLNTPFSKPLRVVALDDQGNRVSGVTVTFMAPASGASGTFAGTGTNTSTVDTDAGGVATSSTFTANNIAGVYFVSASAPGLGAVSFNLEQIAPPANDNFADATQITSLPFNVEASTVRATFESGEPTPSCWSGYSFKTVWFTHTPSTNTPLTMTLGSGSISPVVVIYTGSALDSLTEINCGFGGMSFMAQAGVTYYFQLSDNVGNEGTIPFTLDFTAPPTAEIFYVPSDPHVFESVIIASNTSDAFGIASYAWELSDGTTSDSSSFEHQFAADGDYTANLTVTSVDGLTGSASQVIQVRTHDVAITKVTAPQSARSGQTKAITVAIRNTRYPETVTVDLYKSTPGGDVWIDSLTLEVPARLGNKTKLFTFHYTFTVQDAQVGKVSFRAVATINEARDAFPQDNTVISLPPTRVSR